MFTPEQRDAVVSRLTTLARHDPGVSGWEIVGSLATGTADRWSDIDLVLRVRSDLTERWTTLVYQEFEAVHHWDLWHGTSLYRVFLLPGLLELDLSFHPGPPGQPEPSDPAGLAWHHFLHAHTALRRGRWWQAEHWIGATRAQVLALASARHGLPTAYAKGAHELPLSVTRPLEATLVRSLEPDEVARALEALLPPLREAVGPDIAAALGAFPG